MDFREARSIATFGLEYGALKAVVFVLRCLGVDLASAMMGWLWRWFAPLNARHRRADLHLALAMPHLSAAQRSVILSSMWENLGRTFAEGLLLPEIAGQADRIEVSAGLRSDILACGQSGMVFCSLHQGNWELLAVAAGQIGKPMAGVYRQLKNPYSESYFRSLREGVYGAGLVAAGAASALRLRSIARGGAAIAMMADLPDGTGISAPFFGHPSPLSKLPVTLARHLGLPLLVVRCRRTSGAHFVTEGQRLIIQKTGDADADVAEGARALHATFEGWIRDEPGQWMWATRKWSQDLLETPKGD